MNADGDVDGDDPWFWFAYDERWRIVATFRADDTDPKETFVYHAAGLGGFGGSSYIDSVILRDRDANADWDAASDGVLEERIYYCQNWRRKPTRERDEIVRGIRAEYTRVDDLFVGAVEYVLNYPERFGL